MARRINATTKAESLSCEKVFLVRDSEYKEFYVVKGLSNTIYEVSYDKSKKSYSCTCKNIRLNDCYHVLAVKKCYKKDAL